MTTSTASAPGDRALAPRRGSSTSGLVMAVASALAFSSSGPFIKPLLEAGWSLGAALLVRMGVAGLILVAGAVPRDAPAAVVPAPALAAHPRVRAHAGARLPALLLLGDAADAGGRGAAHPVPRAGACSSRFVWLRTRKAPSRARAVGLGGRDRRPGARRRHLGRVVRPARHAARARRRGVRRAPTS